MQAQTTAPLTLKASGEREAGVCRVAGELADSLTPSVSVHAFRWSIVDVT